MDCTVPYFEVTKMLVEKFRDYKKKLEQMVVDHNLKEGEVISMLVMEVVANNHFIWNGKESMGGLRKGKLIAGGYWGFWRIKISQTNSVTTLSTSALLN